MPEAPQDIFSPREEQPLPQYGFGANCSFESLPLKFLYRVYTPKSHSSVHDSSEHFFTAQSFDEKFTLLSQDLSSSVTSNQLSVASSYADVARHMDWTTRSSSPFISTSSSFTWAIWEAARRYRLSMKHDIQIAVIDARALQGRAVTALELLRKSTPKDRRHQNYWKWYNFAVESQDVLVHGSIPRSAVFASIPLLSILDKLPSYFLSAEIPEKVRTPFDRLAWNSTEKKQSYRQFCQDMSERFLRLPQELRLRDTTTGSVRLTVELLRPWFHKMVLDDFNQATSMVCDLAFVIAQWPGQWWAHDHREVWDLIRSMVTTVGEEIREKQKGEVVIEVKRLQGVVVDLERLVQEQQSRSESRAESHTESRVSSWISSWYDVSRRQLSVDTPPTTPPPESVAAEEIDAIHETEKESATPPQSVRPHSMVETVTCVVTGILFGAFITLSIINSQRRTLITHLT